MTDRAPQAAHTPDPGPGRGPGPAADSTPPRAGSADPAALALGLSCYVIWGLFPLYFRLLQPAGALEVIVHRAWWGLVACLVVTVARRRLPRLRAALRDRRLVVRLALAGALIVVNWTTYVYAVQAGHTVDAALGYFINPLVTVMLGLIVLRERISTAQKAAVGLGAAAVVVMVVGLGRLPWVSLTLAFSFGLYSLVKKGAASRVDAVEGMAIETGAVAPALLIYEAVLAAHGATSFQALADGSGAAAPGGWQGHLALLVGAGVLTMIPLVLFARAARGLPLGVMGLLQYITPVMQLVVGLVVFHETMEPVRWVGTGIVWCALLLLGADGVLGVRRARRLGDGRPTAP